MSCYRRAVIPSVLYAASEDACPLRSDRDLHRTRHSFAGLEEVSFVAGDMDDL